MLGVEEKKAAPGCEKTCSDLYLGRAFWLWNLLISPFILIFHCLRIYVLPCVWALITRTVVKISCCLCEVYCRNCVLFTDNTFPPDESSLGRWSEEHPNEKIKWVRASELKLNGEYENQKLALFAGEIEPKDIAQGALGDCWLLSALACMAEFPGLVRKVFETLEYSPLGKYTVRLYDVGTKQWVRVTVDDHFPVYEDSLEPVFTKPNGRELWVMVLEKAMAKFVGSYGDLDAGNEVWAWAALTGAHVYGFKHTPKHWEKKKYVFPSSSHPSMSHPSLPPPTSSSSPLPASKERVVRVRKTFVDNSKPAETFSHDHFWHVLLLFDFRDSIISASISNNGEQKRSDGLVAGHAYSLLQVKQVNNLRFIQLRNPWGSFEWKGDWGDGSSLWTTHPDVAASLEYKDGDDGAFWMVYDDFVKTYNAIDVCDRDVSINDLTLDRKEDTGFCGIIGGCILGVAKFWCFFEGCRFLYCGHVSSPETPVPGNSCAPWMFVNQPIKKLRTWWHSRDILSRSKTTYYEQLV